MQSFQPTGGDDTAALQSAIAGATSLEILSGDSLISAPLSIDHECEIIWRKGARLLAAHTDCNILSVEGSWCRLVEPRIEGAQLRTGGAYVRLNAGLAHRFKSEGGRFTGYHTGFSINSVSTVTIDDLSCLGGVDGQGSAIEVDGGFDLAIRNLLTDAGVGTRPAAGVLVKSCGDLHIATSGILHHGTCVLVVPAAGKQVASLWITETFLDNSYRGLHVNATGSVVRMKLSDVWAASMEQQGMLLMTQTGGLIDGVEISGAHCFLNAQNGIQAQGNTKNIQIAGGKFGGNTLSGIAIGAGPQHVSIQGARSGDTDGVGPNGGWGCIVYPSGQNYLSIAHNNFRGNTAGALSDQSGAVTKNVKDNL